MIFDVGGDDALLSTGKTAAHGALERRADAVEAHQLMGKHAAESLDVAAIVRLRPFDQPNKLLRRREEMRILEEEARRQGDVAGITSARQLGRQQAAESGLVCCLQLQDTGQV